MTEPFKGIVNVDVTDGLRAGLSGNGDD